MYTIEKNQMSRNRQPYDPVIIAGEHDWIRVDSVKWRCTRCALTCQASFKYCVVYKVHFPRSKCLTVSSYDRIGDYEIRE